MPDLDDLLAKTSRTFALSIPLLPEPTRREVTVAYLLFRVADTFEDSASWPREERIQALGTLCDLLGERDDVATRRWAERWRRDAPIDHAGYLELLGDLPFVLDAFFALRPEAREQVRHHTVRTARGMAGYVARSDVDGRLVLADLADLRAYCYVVAGIVGEVLTDLFVLGRPTLRAVEPRLRERAARFGEGLQLVNILKDSAFDATEGRRFLPPALDRSTVFALARADLEAAREYVATLQDAGADRGLVEFNALPVLLAFATLEKVEREGPGSKVSRPEVYAIVESMHRALDNAQPLFAA